jgi:tetratricopeptide (TPR) repeat protein
MYTKTIMLLLFSTLLIACEQVAVISTPKKTVVASHSTLAATAEKNFWATLHAGDYANIPYATKLLTAAYLENPNDPQLAAHLGFLHIWKITERQREPALADDPTIVNEIILAKEYFAQATALNPNDARLQGFLGDSMLISGQIFNDQRAQVHGYFQLKHAINMWPEFNYFTAGYPMSTLGPHSSHFKEGLAWQWQTLDLCAGTTVDRTHPDYKPYLSRETQTGPQRACWNSWIAPHNFEGFFLNMGDMLVKQGDWQTAVKIYNNAKLSQDYANWPYRQMLEQRIANAQENVANFQKAHGQVPDKVIMFNSSRGCVVCHQKT